MPFSDPLADGPVIHAAGTDGAARGRDASTACSRSARSIAERVPVIVMCYANPILARGPRAASPTRWSTAGASGLIVPDLPLEEAAATLEACDARGLALVPLVAPTTPDERLARIGAQARGFLYTVSLTGTTGERTGGRRTRSRRVAGPRGARARRCRWPSASGSGRPEQAAAAADAGADGVIIGSRLVRAVAESPESPSSVRDLVAGFSEALRA